MKAFQLLNEVPSDVNILTRCISRERQFLNITRRKMLHIDQNDQLANPLQRHVVPTELKTAEALPAKVSNYFLPTITEHQDGHYESVLQGHRLYGRKHQVQNLYRCSLFRNSEDYTQLELVKLARMDNIIEWKRDEVWVQHEGHIALLTKYYNIQEVLHSQEDLL